MASGGGTRSLAWIEAGRTVAMVLVVWTHASNLVFFREGDFSLAPLFAASLVTVAVPAFFWISGYLCGHYDARRPAGEPFARRPARQAARLAPAFFAWNVLSLLTLKYVHGVPLWRWQSLVDLLTGAVQLYFIFAMLQFLAFFCCVNPFATPRRLNRATAWALAATLSFYAASTLLFHADPPRDYRFELVGIRLAPAWAGFFFLGAWLSRHEVVLDGLTRRFPLLLAGAVLAFGLYLWQVAAEAAALGANFRQYFLLSGLAFQVLGSLALLTGLRRLDARGGGRAFALLADAGRDTLGVYISHYVLLLVFYALLPPPVAPAWRLPVGALGAILAFGGSLLLTRLSRRLAVPRLTRLLFAHA